MTSVQVRALTAVGYGENSTLTVDIAPSNARTCVYVTSVHLI